MNRRRSRRSVDCSRLSSRRSKAKTPVILILLLLASVSGSAQEARLDAELRGRTVYGAIEYTGSHSQEVLASLWDGLRAEIIFELRLYKRNRGVFAFLGDRLLQELRVDKIASFDFYENRYNILAGEREAGDYAAEGEFLDAFFTLPETELGEIEIGGEAEYYLLARVRMMPVKLIAPLNIITLFASETVFATPWVEAELSL